MTETAGARFEQLVGIMRTLRSEHGCAWDKQQTLKTLRPFVLQETYELLDALDREDYHAIEHELGDFLFEAVFLAQICEEEGRFSIADAIKAIADKLIRRHPHIFGDVVADTADFVGRGEAGAFIAEGNTEPGGRLPMNTSGGGMSYAHTGAYGMLCMLESIRQVRTR